MNNKAPSEGRRAGISLITLMSIAGTVLGFFNEMADFWERLDTDGLTQALSGSSIVLILGATAVILSFIYLIYSGKLKRQKKRRAKVLAEKAEAEGTEIPAPTAGSRAGSVFGAALDAVTKTIIAIFIILLIVACVFVGIEVNEFQNRPVVDMISYVDASGSVVGYDELGYVDKDKIKYTLPEDIREIYKTSSNYKVDKDYSEQQALWDQVRQDLVYTIVPDPSESGSLSNGDKVTVTVSLPGYTLPKLQGDLNIKITGLDTPKETEVSGLPHKFKDGKQAMEEKADIIAAAKDRLNHKAYENCGDFDGSPYSGLTIDEAYLCKPNVNPDINPDALLVLGHYLVNAGTEYASQDTLIFYLYPFDSNTATEDLENEFVYSGEDEVRAVTEIHSYKSPESVREQFASGIYFSAGAAYTLTEIPQ